MGQWSRRIRPVYWMVAAWAVLTMSVAAVATLKKSPKAGELGFLTHDMANWLDVNYDLRTLLMVLLVTLPTSVLLGMAATTRIRRSVLFCLAVPLVLFEVLQVFIPSRGFGWADLGYTLLGIGMAEAAGMLSHAISVRMLTLSRPLPIENSSADRR